MGLKFADLFAGCGGLSLGLSSSGLHGVLAVERDPSAFATLRRNLLKGDVYRFEWPSWLSEEAIEIATFIRRYRGKLEELCGEIDVIAGGPPCQGFSLAGRRQEGDPRNRLFRQYLKVIRLVKPKYVLLENVKGISVAFTNIGNRRKPGNSPFSDKIRRGLEREGYRVFHRLVRGTDIGVPQFRPRFIMLALRSDLVRGRELFDPFDSFDVHCKDFLVAKGLPTTRPISTREAISDLETGGGTIESADTPGFREPRYKGPRTHYQRILHGTMNGSSPDSLRLANHRPATKRRFELILATCRRGVQLSDKDRTTFGLRKQCVVPLAADRPSHTLTTLPDDFIHYSEPRILTVREYARLQSFPDWFAFEGNYTTGGMRRKQECPRYTQVGNAVPPFLGEVMGRLILSIDKGLK